MTVVAAACSVLTAVAAGMLLLRLGSARRDGRVRLKAAAARDDFPLRVFRLVRLGIDAGLLGEAGPGGLAEVEIRSRESRDPYRMAAALIDWLAHESAATGYAEVNALIKSVYQLGSALRAPESSVSLCLEPLIVRMKTCHVGGTPIARVERIATDAMLDPRTMAPLNYGTRVKLPLGVVVYDAGDKVLGKAKVLCG